MTYLRVQGVFWPIIVSPAMGGLAMYIFGYAFVIVGNMGVDGIALAFSLANSIIFAFYLGYIFKTKIYLNTWPGWSTQAFKDWGQFSKLGLAGVGLMVSEYAILEAIIILTGTMGPVSLAVGVIAFQIMNILYNISLGFAVAGAVRVGISLGAGDIGAARRAVWFSLGLGFIISGVCDLITVIVRYPIMYIFTNDVEVVELGATVILIVCADNIAQLVFITLQAILRGCGRHVVVSVIDLVCIYLIGIPCLIGFVLGLDAGVQECWIIDI